MVAKEVGKKKGLSCFVVRVCNAAAVRRSMPALSSSMFYRPFAVKASPRRRRIDVGVVQVADLVRVSHCPFFPIRILLKPRSSSMMGVFSHRDATIAFLSFGVVLKIDPRCSGFTMMAGDG